MRRRPIEIDSLSSQWTLAICALLLGMFAAMSYSAAWQKNATWDEPEHLLGAYLHRFHGDYRVNPEDPALFGWLSSIPLKREDLRVDVGSPVFAQILDHPAHQFTYIWLTLYKTGGNDAERLLRKSRAVSTAIGVLLGASIVWWSYRIAGPVAAIFAAILFAFCPNFLAHSSLVKNDVMLSAAVLGVMLALWRFGRRASAWNFTAIALLSGAAASVKYSGVLCGAFVAIALIVRALLPKPWQVLGLTLDKRLARLAVSATTSLLVAVVAYGIIWACYGFRFAPTPNPAVRLNMDTVVESTRQNLLLARLTRKAGTASELESAVQNVTREQIDSEPLPAVVRFALWMHERELLPQPWLLGFIYTYKSTLIRSAFLRGEISITGWWYFFPASMLFKTPLATLVAAALALCVTVLRRLESPLLNRAEPLIDHWSFACLLIAPVIYMISAMSTNLNLGLRHVLPVYPFIFIGTAVALRAVFVRWGMLGKFIVALIALGLIVECIAAYPNYISFFNTPSGGARGGIRLLGDSNLDWGQDLRLLKKWQDENPSEKIYLSYFGMADPEWFGIKAFHLPGGYPYGQQFVNPVEPGVLAMSATQIQGIYIGNPRDREIYRQFLDREPIEVLGGSIYLFRFPLDEQSREAPPDSR